MLAGSLASALDNILKKVFGFSYISVTDQVLMSIRVSSFLPLPSLV